MPKLAQVSELVDHMTEDRESGAMRSVQSADVTLGQRELQKLWTPGHLERLARTYWRFIARVTLGLVRVVYSESERSVVLLERHLKLLTFDAPEYEMDAERGVVRWRIKRGLLVARSGHDALGHLQIDVRRLPARADDGAGTQADGRGGAQADGRGGAQADGRAGTQTDGWARLHIEVEVANFHPAIATRLGKRVYNATQAKIHVFVTNGFLRSLARLDLAESRIGQFARADEP